MIRTPFQFHAPRSLEEAIQTLLKSEQRGEEAKILAGGQSMLPAMNLALVHPAHIVSLNHIPDLSYIRKDSNTICIGTCASHRELFQSNTLRADCPILSETAGGIGDVQVRNRGTLGGAISHFDPAADYPAVLLLSDATFRILGPTGERTCNADEFFLDYMTTSLGPTDILREIRVPAIPPQSGSAYLKFARIEGGFAIVGVAARLRLQPDGTCQSVRIAICGGGPCPIRLRNLETTMINAPIDSDFLDAVCDVAYEAALEPLEELHANKEYKRSMVRVFTRRALQKALERTSRR